MGKISDSFVDFVKLLFGEDSHSFFSISLW